MIPAYTNFFASLAAATSAWFFAMFLLRTESFHATGGRRIPLPIESNTPSSDKDLYDQRKYHGEGIYRDMDLFFKISLALFGGVAAIALSKSATENPRLTRELIDWALWIQMFSAIFTAIFVLAHKRSCVLRWKNTFPMWHVLLWGDTWGYIAGMSVSFYAFFVVGPTITDLIPLR